MVIKRWMPRPRRFPAFVQILGCMLLVSVTSVGAQNTQRPTTLQAEVNHDETLPRVPEQYQIGNQLDTAKLQAEMPDNTWFPIPNWLAGSWHSESKLIDYVQDCKTGASMAPHMVVKEVGSTIHGHQRDKSGRIWEFIQIPHLRKIGLANGTAYVRAVKEDVIATDLSAVIVKVLSNQITVSEKNQQIVASNQVQQIGTYTPLDDGLVQLSASVRNFDNDGAAIQLQKQSLTMKRSAPYADMDNLDGLDLKKLFSEYLTKTGRPDLLPPSN
ncbi:hypothetical protein BH10CYA1_BH10CYA1_11490 [soil metagenome]